MEKKKLKQQIFLLILALIGVIVLAVFLNYNAGKNIPKQINQEQVNNENTTNIDELMNNLKGLINEQENTKEQMKITSEETKTVTTDNNEMIIIEDNDLD